MSLLDPDTLTDYWPSTVWSIGSLGNEGDERERQRERDSEEGGREGKERGRGGERERERMEGERVAG